MNKFRLSLNGFRFLLILIAAPFLAVPSVVVAQDDEDLEEFEAFSVTGSNIRRIDQEPINPVISFTSDDLKDQGFTTVGDALRSLSFNNGQSLTSADAGTSFTPGVSTLNLRGLGNNQTLVLINGRRGAPYAAPGFDGLQSVFDLNSIPEGAIERIDILKDGASAIYGSDAVAGVINVVLKDDFEGLNVSAMAGDFFDTGAFFRKATATVGTTSAKTSIVVSLSAEDQAPVFNRDLDFSSNANQTDRAPDADPRWVLFGYETLTQDSLDAVGVSSEAQFFDEIIPLFVGDPYNAANADDGWFDNRSTRGFPGYVGFDFNGNGSISGGERRTWDVDDYPNGVDDPTAQVGDAIASRNFYNYQEASGLFPQYRRYSFYTRAKHEFSESLYGVLELSFSRTESEVYAAATPVDIEDSRGLDQADQLTLFSVIPYDYDGDGLIEYAADLDDPSIGFVNPMNPFGVDFQNGRRRFVEFPARLSDVKADTPRIVAVLGGKINGNEDWNWETGFSYSENTVNVINVAAQDSKLQQAFLGLTRLGDGSFSWDPSTPPEDREYFNWFGINEDAFVDYITIENPNSAGFELTSYDAKVDGVIAELPGGPMGVALGFEHRSERWYNTKTELNATSDILGGSEGTSSAGERNLSSLFAELILPVHEMVEIQLAARFESYSDEGFAEDIRPKAAVKFKPTDWLLFRASYSESFKAPDLPYLYTASTTTFTAFQSVDPVTQTEIDQLQVVVAGNPDLAPETSENYYAGVTFEPGQALFNGTLDGLVMSVEWFFFDRENLLAQLSDFFGYAEFISGEANGDPLFAGKVVRDSTNQLLFIRDDYANISDSQYKGIDLDISYVYRTEDLGNFRFAWNTTYLQSLRIDGGDLVGSWLVPEWRHTVTTNWQRGDWSATLFGNYISQRTRNIDFYGSGLLSNYFGIGGDEDETQIILRYDVDSQWVWNANVTYSGVANTDITVGVNNLLNEEPPVDPFEGLGATAGVNYLAPAFWYVRVDRDF